MTHSDLLTHLTRDPRPADPLSSLRGRARNVENRPYLGGISGRFPHCCNYLLALLINCFYHTHTHTHTHPFNGPFSGTTRVSRYQKGKTNLDFTEARNSEWQWHQLGHMQVCISLQTDTPAPHCSVVFTGRMPFLPPNQQRQSTEGIETT